MPKKKKTREQKILAEIRRKQQLLSEERYSYSVKETKQKLKPSSELQTAQISTPVIQAADHHYAYLIRDLKKTISISACIIIIQFILHYFLK